MRFRTPRNLGWKIGSLLLAILLWTAMSLEPEVVVMRDAPVLYENVPSDRMLTGDTPETVRLELRGRAADFTPDGLAGISVAFDVPKTLLAAAPTSEEKLDSKRTEAAASVYAARLNLPRGVTLVRAIPPEVRFGLARLASKTVPVAVQFIGSLRPGRSLLSFESVPGTLTVAGPDSDLAGTVAVQTAPIDLTRLSAEAEVRTVEIPVNALRPRPNLYFPSSPSVTVKLVLGTAQDSSNLTGLHKTGDKYDK